jgi:DNA-binding transcriptional LysR family regulator
MGRRVNPDLRVGKLVQVLPGYRLPDIDVLALHPSRRHLSAKIRAVIDFLVDAFGGLPPWDRADGG